jgi:vacuolar-type H+-ATPase subunit E/Vma4
VGDEEARVLLDEIRAQAEAERQRIVQEGRDRAAAVWEKAQVEVRRLEAEALRQLERRLAVDEDRILGEARLEAGGRLLAVRREWIERVFQLAGRRLAERCASPAYEDLLAALMREAAAELGGPGELRVAEADLELARKVARRLGLTHEVRGEGGEPGTMIAVSRDRRVDNSLATRLQVAERSLEREVARLLFTDA